MTNPSIQLRSLGLGEEELSWCAIITWDEHVELAVGATQAEAVAKLIETKRVSQEPALFYHLEMLWDSVADGPAIWTHRASKGSRSGARPRPRCSWVSSRWWRQRRWPPPAPGADRRGPSHTSCPCRCAAFGQDVEDALLILGNHHAGGGLGARWPGRHLELARSGTLALLGPLTPNNTSLGSEVQAFRRKTSGHRP